jgi:hypothetical protein
MSLFTYSPLKESRNEIRLLRVSKPKSSFFGNVTLDCELVHVSLDDYTPQYAEFMKLDGAERTAWDRAVLWDHITTDDESRRKFGQTWEALKSTEFRIGALDTFTDKPTYRVPGKHAKDTARWTWGDFYALSYTWGDDGVTRPIRVNGKEIHVTKNLRDALRQWYDIEQYQKGQYGRLHIWADALCIDQRNEDERNVEVKRMGTIFSEARLVIAWAGRELRHGNRLMELLSRMNANPRSEINARDAEAVFELACRPYWTRLWVIQEMLLANGGACICFGNQAFKLNQWFYLVNALRIHWASIKQHGGPRPVQKLLAFAMSERLSSLATFRVRDAPQPDLATLMHASRFARQTEPRDKVYAMLGLMDPALRDLVRPDYSATILEVYRQFVRSTIRFSGKLEMIYQGAFMTARNSAFPSWVPDWRLSSDFEALPPSQANKPRAACDSRHDYLAEEDSSDPNRLTCRGFRVDVVHGLGCSDWPHDAHNRALPSSDKGAGASPSPYGSDDAVRDALLETLHLGRLTFVWPDIADLLRALPWFDAKGEKRRLRYNDKLIQNTSMFRAITCFEQCNGAMLIAGKPMASYFPPPPAGDCNIPLGLGGGAGEGIGMTLEALIAILFIQRLATTAGGYLGMVPKRAQAGDQIFVLLGCDVPLLLRPSPGDDGTYRLIGDCYVPGIMKGEAMEWLGSGRCELETVILV